MSFIKVAREAGRAIRRRFNEGGFTLLFGDRYYNKGDRIRYRDEVFHISYPSTVADAPNGCIFNNLDDNGDLYYKDLAGAAGKLGAGSAGGGDVVLGEVGSFTEATSGSFNLGQNQGYAMQFIGKASGNAVTFSFVVGPNATTADTTMEMGVYDSAGTLISKEIFVLPSGSVGLVNIAIPTSLPIVKGQPYFLGHTNGSGVIVEIARSYTTTTNYSQFIGSGTLPASINPTTLDTNRLWWALIG